MMPRKVLVVSLFLYTFAVCSFIETSAIHDSLKTLIFSLAPIAFFRFCAFLWVMDSNHGSSQKKPSDLYHYHQVWLVNLREYRMTLDGAWKRWNFLSPISVCHQPTLPPCSIDTLQWNLVLKGRKWLVFSDLSADPIILSPSVIFKMLQRLLSRSAGDCLQPVNQETSFSASLTLLLFPASWRRSESRCWFVGFLLDLCFVSSLSPGF